MANPEALQSSKVSPLDTLYSKSVAERYVLWFNNHACFSLRVNMVNYVTKSFIKIPGLGIRYTKEQKLK